MQLSDEGGRKIDAAIARIAQHTIAVTPDEVMPPPTDQPDETEPTHGTGEGLVADVALLAQRYADLKARTISGGWPLVVEEVEAAELRADSGWPPPPNWDRRPYAGEEGWSEQHRAFRDWLMTELREAGCEIRLLSPMGMGQVTVEHMVRQGWTVTPPGDATEFVSWLRRKRNEAASLGRRTRYAAIDSLLHDYLKETDGTPDTQHH